MAYLSAPNLSDLPSWTGANLLLRPISLRAPNLDDLPTGTSANLFRVLLPGPGPIFTQGFLRVPAANQLSPPAVGGQVGFPI